MPSHQQPDFLVIANNQDITTTLRQRLLSLTITDEAGIQSDTLEITIDDRDNRVQWPTHGAELVVSLGYIGTPLRRMGVYTVDELEHSGPPDTIVIRAKAANMQSSIKAQKTRSFSNIALGNLVATLAAQHNLSPRVAAELQTIVIPHIDQTDESDLHLLTRLAKDYDAVSKPVSGFWVFVPRGETKSALGKLLPIVEVQKNQVIRHRMTQAERSRYQSVRTFFYDTFSAEKKSILAGEGEPAFVVRHLYPSQSQSQAKSAGIAKLNLFRRGTGVLSLTLVGHPMIEAEGKIALSGFRDQVSGEWSIERAEHELTHQGFIARCSAKTPN